MPVATSAATFARLLQALEELGRREDIALAAGDAHEFLELERRSEPLARRVAEMVASGERVPEAIQQRGQSLVLARRDRQTLLLRFMQTLRDEVGRLDTARARARQLRAQSSSAGSGAFCAQG